MGVSGKQRHGVPRTEPRLLFPVGQLVARIHPHHSVERQPGNRTESHGYSHQSYPYHILSQYAGQKLIRCVGYAHSIVRSLNTAVQSWGGQEERGSAARIFLCCGLLRIQSNLNLFLRLPRRGLPRPCVYFQAFTPRTTTPKLFLGLSHPAGLSHLILTHRSPHLQGYRTPSCHAPSRGNRRAGYYTRG